MGRPNLSRESKFTGAKGDREIKYWKVSTLIANRPTGKYFSRLANILVMIRVIVVVVPRFSHSAICLVANPKKRKNNSTRWPIPLL